MFGASGDYPNDSSAAKLPLDFLRFGFWFGHKGKHKWNGHFGFWASARNIKTHTLAKRWYDLAWSDPHTTIDTRNAVKQMQFWCVWVWLTRQQTFSESDFSCSPMKRCKLNYEQLTMVRAFWRSVLKWYIVIRMPSNLVLPTTSSHEILLSAGHCNHRRYGGHTPQTNMYFFEMCVKLEGSRYRSCLTVLMTV